MQTFNQMREKGFTAVFIVVGVVIILGLLGGAYYFSTQQKQTEITPITSIPTPKISASPVLEESPYIKPTTPNPQSYLLPNDWQKYTDEDSGMIIYHPSSYTTKYNSNRGAAVSFSAGSYLLNSNGQKLLDFYYYPYNGGSRREAFYKAVEFDGPDDMSKYTASASDVVLNGKTYLKLVTTYYATEEKGKRVFFLISQGQKLYYFTYLQSLESDKIIYNNILTIIANSRMAPVNDNSDNVISCYSKSDISNKGKDWDVNIDSSGNMIVIQRTNKILKQQEINKSLISISGNPQDSSYKYFPIINFDITIDSSQKAGFEDAFVIKIKKGEVDKLIQQTPATVPSIAIITSINGGIETTSGERCKADLFGYFTSKPSN